MKLGMDIIGKRFGKLVVLELDHKTKGVTFWLCRCDCGKMSVVRRSGLLGGTSSCGCREGKYSHGLSKTRLYRIWCGLMSRLFDESSVNYKDYGGRGITCPETWRTIEGFIEEMGPSYIDGFSIERIDPNGNYCKENCEWIPKGEQPFNRTLSTNNTSGHVGVCYYLLPDGSSYWRASWSDPLINKRESNNFSIKKYGFDEAKELAIAHRRKMIEYLISHGVPYKPTHGVPKEFRQLDNKEVQHETCI